ncbi:hypothetical protein Dimus_035317, partial [Dionaea muscipula]
DVSVNVAEVVNADLKVDYVNDDVMEVEIAEKNISTLDDEEELFDIDDVDAFINIDIAEKVDMDLAEEVAIEVENNANKEKAGIAAEPLMYRRRRKSKKTYPKRNLIVSESEEEEVNAAIATP